MKDTKLISSRSHARPERARVQSVRCRGVIYTFFTRAAPSTLGAQKTEFRSVSREGAKARQIRFLSAWAALALGVLWVSPLEAQFIKANENGYRTTKDLASDLNSAAGKSADSQDYSALSSLADKYVSALDNLSGNLDGIGGQVQESENRSALSRMKDTVSSKAKRALDSAKSLKSKADSKSDPASEISDLRQALSDLSDSFRDCWKDHERYREQLDRDYQDACRKWQDSTKDENRVVYAAWKNIAVAEEQVKKAQEKFDTAYKNLAGAWDEAKSADDALSSTINNPSANFGDILAAWDKKHTNYTDGIAKASKELDAARTEWNNSETGVQKSKDDYQKALEDYNKLMENTDNPLVQDILKKHKLRVDFATEYRSISL